MRARTDRTSGSVLSDGQRRVIRRRLPAWYARCKRDLPWRRRQDDAYAQLLAEVMLQQTQAATVAAYYERFMARFPTVRDLAAAEPGEVLALWSGLGYYARGRNLHAAARRLVEGFGGIVPHTVEELMSLPGIGRYTAGAIASVAYDVRAPVLDGNVGRVLTRVLGIEEDPKAPAVRAGLWAAAEDLLPRTRCGDFNQALMELGATVCLPKSPQCLTCPIQPACGAFRDGRTDRIPACSRRARVVPTRMVVAAICRGDGALLFVQRPDKGLWGGLWELPSEPAGEGEDLDEARRRLADRLRSIGRLDATPVGKVTRLLTHRRITFAVFRGRCTKRSEVRRIGSRPGRWVKPEELHALGVSRACEAVLAMVGERIPKGGMD